MSLARSTSTSIYAPETISAQALVSVDETPVITRFKSRNRTVRDRVKLCCRPFCCTGVACGGGRACVSMRRGGGVGVVGGDRRHRRHYYTMWPRIDATGCSGVQRGPILTIFPFTMNKKWCKFNSILPLNTKYTYTIFLVCCTAIYTIQEGFIINLLCHVIA